MKLLIAWLQMLFVSVTPTPVSPTPTPLPVAWTVTDNRLVYQVAVTKVPKTAQVKLIDNLTDKLSVDELMQLHKCLAGINGGFYDTADKPLGLMVVDGVTLAKARPSTLFNGFVYDQLQIASQAPDKLKYATQTGPIVIKNGVVQTLKLKNDSYDRRMVVARSMAGDTWLMAIYGDSAFDGPQLATLGVLVSKISDKYGLEIASAINMDGGTASAFYSPTTTLPEFNRVGSWWCVSET